MHRRYIYYACAGNVETDTIEIPPLSSSGVTEITVSNDVILQCSRFFTISIVSTAPVLFINEASSTITIELQDDEGTCRFFTA